jgi:predicted nucleic acid-binding protein
VNRSVPSRAFWTFVDTGGYAALLNPRDQRHADATAIYARLRGEHWRLFTTNFILAETHALLLSKAGSRLAREALTTIQASAATHNPPSERKG